MTKRILQDPDAVAKELHAQSIDRLSFIAQFLEMRVRKTPIPEPFGMDPQKAQIAWDDMREKLVLFRHHIDSALHLLNDPDLQAILYTELARAHEDGEDD